MEINTGKRSGCLILSTPRLDRTPPNKSAPPTTSGKDAPRWKHAETAAPRWTTEVERLEQLSGSLCSL